MPDPTPEPVTGTVIHIEVKGASFSYTVSGGSPITVLGALHACAQMYWADSGPKNQAASNIVKLPPGARLG